MINVFGYIFGNIIINLLVNITINIINLFGNIITTSTYLGLKYIYIYIRLFRNNLFYFYYLHIFKTL